MDKMGPTLVVDNGGYTVKAGFAGDSEPRVYPNCIVKSKSNRFRVYVSDQVEELKVRNTLYYLLPYQRGLLLHYDVQCKIWDHLFSASRLDVNAKETCLVITEPLFNIPKCRHTLWEVLLEDYGFQSIYCAPATLFTAYKYAHENRAQRACLVIDSGYSCTYVAPYYHGELIKEATFRLDVGGKVLTNYLKEVVSYRQINVLNETYIMNECKEQVCFVSENFTSDMLLSNGKSAGDNPLLRRYALPDFVNHFHGRIVEKEDPASGPTGGYDNVQLALNRERFLIPELLFTPSIADVRQMGLAELVAHSVLDKCPKEAVPALLNNILLTGGNCCLKGFQKRLWADLRSMVPEQYNIRVRLAEAPAQNAWHGGRLLAAGSADLADLVVTKLDYQEYGPVFCERKFIY